VGSGLRALRKPVHSSLDDAQIWIVVLLDGIPVRDHQNDGPRRPKHAYMSGMPDLRADETRDQK